MKFFTATMLLAFATSGVWSKEEISPLKSSYSSLSTFVKERHSRDTLDVPEWLQDIPEESKVAKYRKRRFLSFPTGSTLEFDVSFTIKVPDIPEISSFQFIINMDLSLNNETDFVFGRSLGHHDRYDVFHAAERVIDNFGFDGKACTLRSICEVAEMPFDHGVFGEVVNYILTVTMGTSNLLESNEIADDYSQAEFQGRHHGSCDTLYPECPISLTNVLSTVQHYSG